MNDHSGNLFEFAADFARRPLSPALADAAALRLTDTLGCAVYGGGQEWTQIGTGLLLWVVLPGAFGVWRILRSEVK